MVSALRAEYELKHCWPGNGVRLTHFSWTLDRGGVQAKVCTSG